MKNEKIILKVPQKLYESRRNRLRRLIELNAPMIILRNEAKLFLRCFNRKTFAEWWCDWMRKWPEWLLWLTSPRYRAIKREDEDDQ